MYNFLTFIILLAVPVLLDTHGSKNTQSTPYYTVVLMPTSCQPGTASSEWAAELDVTLDGDWYPEYDYFLYARRFVNGQVTMDWYSVAPFGRENHFKLDGDNGCYGKGLWEVEVYAIVRVPPPRVPNYYYSEHVCLPYYCGCSPAGPCNPPTYGCNRF